MTDQSPIVCWLEDCNKDSLLLVGGKNASLGELINADIRVPPGFAVTTEGYRRFIDESNLAADILDPLDGLAHDDLTKLEEVSRTIREKIEAAPFSIEFEDEIAEYYRRLSNRCQVPAVPVAVRSSATAEDLPDASFAGQQDTFLWIRGVDNLLLHVKRCFSSLFTARAISYRIKMDFDHADVEISVGVQKMANSFAAGVLFTINPTTGDRSSIVINSSFGFGEAVVSGEVTPDEFLVNKVSLEVLQRTITTKEIYYTVDHENHESRVQELPAERRNVQSIVDEEIAELARMGKLIEQHYGRPMDIEWAVDNDMPAGGNVFILQARPETVWSSKPKQRVSEVEGSNPMDHIVAAMMTGRSLS